MSAEQMIRAEGLRKTFKAGKETVEAVRDVSFDVAAGELVALLGPSGAGKSTTLRMLTTLLPPTEGTVRIAGHDAAQHPGRARESIGYVGQKNASGENHRIRDELTTQGRCYGLTTRSARGRADEVLDVLGIGDLASRRPGTLSGGQRRRVDIALGLIHHPRVLFLDEPSTGLYPQSRAGLWEQIQLLRQLGVEPDAPGEPARTGPGALRPGRRHRRPRLRAADVPGRDLGRGRPGRSADAEVHPRGVGGAVRAAGGQRRVGN